MRRTLAFLLFGFLSLRAFATGAEPVERDLGLGLAYVRVHALPADLPAAPAKPTPLALDLRYAQGDANAAIALGAWIRFRASVKTPVFVLVNGGTAPALLDFFETTAPIPGLITLGNASLRFVPDITLKTSPESERAAYDALEHGQSLENLLADNPAKPRHDEASIARERTEAPLGEDDTEEALTDITESAVAKPPAPAPLVDRSLQRTVQVHRALLALRRI